MMLDSLKDASRALALCTPLLIASPSQALLPRAPFTSAHKAYCECICLDVIGKPSPIDILSPDNTITGCSQIKKGDRCQTAIGVEGKILDKCSGIWKPDPQPGEEAPAALAAPPIDIPQERVSDVAPVEPFNCGPHMTRYVSALSVGSRANTVMCTDFFNTEPRHDGFFWYSERRNTDGSVTQRIGRYTKGNRRDDIVIELAPSTGVSPALIVANFEVEHSAITGEIEFKTPAFSDKWVRPKHDEPQYEREAFPLKRCGRNFLRFRPADGLTLKPGDSGVVCFSPRFLTYYSQGQLSGDTFMRIGTAGDARSALTNVIYGGLPMIVADVCEGTDLCRGSQNVTLRASCRQLDGVRETVLHFEQTDNKTEFWLPDFEDERDTLGVEACAALQVQ